MEPSSLLSKQIRLPSLRLKYFAYALLLVVLPNLLFWILAGLTGTARPIINLDYIAAAALFALGWKPAKWAGVLLFWAALLFDVLMLVMQQFPFMDLLGAIYLAPFIMKAPLLYQVLTGSLLLYFLLMPLILSKTADKTDFFHVSILVAPLLIAAYFTGHLQYYERSAQFNLFGANNFYYAKSQYLLYSSSQNAEFIRQGLHSPVFMPLKNQQRAASHLLKPQSDKILMIVAESWGQPDKQALQDAVLAKLSEQKDRFSVWEGGSFNFIGATVEGEMRELCSYSRVHGFGLRHAPDEKFAQCLPNLLQKEGYRTFALHGASSALYDRFSWYPKAGFEEVKTAENMIGKKTCSAFGGVCDSVLFDEVSSFFGKYNKGLFYWMTLTSHADYPESDLFDHRLQCEQYGLPTDTDLCRNFSLHTQFFDGLAELVKRPEMKGVEVIVVGDHPPPVKNIGETIKYLEQGQVAWLHFKVKD